LAEDSEVRLVVYDIQGKVIKELVNGFKTAGTYKVDFDGSDYASGVYFYKLVAVNIKSNFTDVRRMLLVK